MSIPSIAKPASVRWLCLLMAAGSLTAWAGCDRGEISEIGDGPSAVEIAAFYSPTSIEILPFTKIRSFDDDIIPDGLGVSMRTLDGAGDSVKAYGTFIFELYSYRKASADHRGELLQTWTQSIHSPDEQRQFWERVTTTYEFQLSWEGQPLPPDQRYVISASFQAPGGRRLFDQYEFEFRINRQELRDAISGS